MHLQGQEFPAHDPKLGYHFATVYRMDATPARHTQGGEGFVPLDLVKYDSKSFAGRGLAHKRGSNLSHIMNASGMCMFMYMTLPSAHVIPDFMSSITGWNVDLDDMLMTGERIANMRHVFNLREGLNPLKFDVPKRLLGIPPQKAGPLAGVTVDEKTLDKEYVAEMDWGLRSAKPSRKKLLELGLYDVAKDLYPRS